MEIANGKIVINVDGDETKPSDQWQHDWNSVSSDIDITYKLNHPVIVFHNYMDNVNNFAREL